MTGLVTIASLLAQALDPAKSLLDVSPSDARNLIGPSYSGGEGTPINVKKLLECVAGNARATHADSARSRILILSCLF